MKLLAKWVLDNRTDVPEEVACTSKLCYWSVPQGRNRTQKAPISEINFTSPESRRKRKNDVNSGDDDDDNHDTRHHDGNRLSSLVVNLQNDNAMALNVINASKCQYDFNS